jgi:hydroxymethylbilane synthase
MAAKMTARLRIGTRPSALALAQTGLITRQLQTLVGGFEVELVPISTTGDKLTTASLARVGGKGLFIREIEQALSAGRIDLAVHSLKDLPAVLAPAYRIAAIPARENACDALITRECSGWAMLPAGARLGTSSARRRLEALRLRPDLRVLPLRGNVDTRIRRLDDGDFDAIILAMAGLKRLDRVAGLNLTELAERDFIPSAGQGALALETLADKQPADSAELAAALARLDDPATHAEVSAERAFLATIGASCVSPVGVKGTVREGFLSLRALLFSLDGAQSLAGEILEPYPHLPSADESIACATAVGAALGARMLAQGAGQFIVDG